MSLEAGLAYAHLLAILSLVVFLSSEAALCRVEWMNEAVVRRLGGSFSAEHGVGRLKTDMLAEWRGGAEYAAMRAVKAALDPQGIMNPGVVFPAP